MSRWHHGYLAETQVEQMLQRHGCAIFARRYKTPLGEIDLIVADQETLVFVEVKRRPSLIDAAHCVSKKQIARIKAAAALCLSMRPEWIRNAMRIDLIVVDCKGAMRRVKDIGRDD